MSIRRDLRTRRFWERMTTQTFAAFGLMAASMGVYDVIDPDAISRLSIPVLPLVGAACVAYGAARSWPRPVEQVYSSPNTAIRVVVGDLFDTADNLVIGMCDTFDTSVPHIIRPASIQGQFLARMYQHDIATLDQELQSALADIPVSSTIEKPGKSTRYPLGTVATIRHGRRHFFCVAYTEMDEANRASGTVDGIWRSLQELWREVEARANGEPLAIPVIGGGQARISQILPAQDSIRFIALSFMLASRRSRVCERLDIVVREEDVDKLDMLEIQAFLSSLRPS